jgi:multicomponent Na+:H+ antiporter subunit B
MSRGARLVLAGGGLAALAVVLTAALLDLPRFGHAPKAYGDAAVRATVNERHVSEAVTGVTFDVRGFDTLGEELILFVAAIGSAVLLRAGRSERSAQQAAEREDARGPSTSDALRALGAAMTGPFVLLGLYIVAHGHITPGGGFQGGVIAAGALLLVYAAGQVAALQRVRPLPLVEVTEAVGALAYALVAIGGLVFAVAVMANFLELGTAGKILSGGTIPVLSVAVGVEVTGALTLVFSEFLEQMLLRGAAE